MEKINIFWFRRDLRIFDNHGLAEIFSQNKSNIYPVFIFDENICDSLAIDDHRITLIYSLVSKLNNELKPFNSSIHIYKGEPLSIFKELSNRFTIQSVFANEDYEQYGIKRDKSISKLFQTENIDFQLFQDHVIVKPGEIRKKDQSIYQIYTPFKNQYLSSLSAIDCLEHEVILNTKQLYQSETTFPNLNDLGFIESNIKVPEIHLSELDDYDEKRNFPSLDATSKLGSSLRFGSVSIRKLFRDHKHKDVFISELIWREFFIHILYFYPNSSDSPFKSKYDCIPWRNNADEFKKWCNGETGYPLVDAGMRELNQTGFMHNRVRMVVASFLCKHLLIDWKWGERYFAKKLFDFDLASNVGNWQWAAGTGCDAAPYFRVFNPITQHQKFDKHSKYVSKWVPEWQNLDYRPMLDHAFARKRAIDTYKQALESK